MKKLIGLIALFVFAAVMSYAATSDPATGEAHAKIVSAAAITHESTVLDFGTLVKPTAAATVTLDHVASPTPVDSGVTRAAGSVSTDHFSLSGLESGVQYTLEIPATTTISDGNSHSMTVHLDPSATSFTGTVAGTDDLYVGGTLDIKANQDPGDYTGSYQVSLTY